MTLLRLLSAIIIIAFIPVQFSVGNELIIDNSIVDIDDARVNQPDFEAEEPGEKNIMLAVCMKSVCEPNSGK